MSILPPRPKAGEIPAGPSQFQSSGMAEALLSLLCGPIPSLALSCFPPFPADAYPGDSPKKTSCSQTSASEAVSRETDLRQRLLTYSLYICKC